MKKILKYTSLVPIAIVFMGVTVKNPAPDLFSNLFGANPEFKTIIPIVINILLGFAGLIAIAYVIWGGYQYLTSGTNPEGSENGKKTLTNAIIGLVIIILSYVILSIVVNLAFGRAG